MIIGNPKVSIILTSYNNPFVERAIKSVFNQTYKNWELILLDDNSNKKEVLKIYEKYINHPKVKFFNSKIKEEDRWKECPYARQINIGLKMATGKLISYMCDDVEYLPHRLEKMVKFLKKHPFVKVCYGRQYLKIIQNGKVVYERILKPDRILRDPTKKVDHNSIMHYKSCLKKVGLWITKPPIETDFSKRELFRMADAWFFRKLGKYYPFYPIKEILDIHYHTEQGFSEKVFKKFGYKGIYD